MAHEKLNFSYKKYSGELDSRNAWNLVGYLFSNVVLEKVFPDQSILKSGYRCQSSRGDQQLLITKSCKKSCRTKIFFFWMNNKLPYSQVRSTSSSNLYDYIAGNPRTPKLTPYGIFFGGTLKSKFLFNDTYNVHYRVQPLDEDIDSGESGVRLTLNLTPYNVSGTDKEDDPFNRNLKCYKQ